MLPYFRLSNFYFFYFALLGILAPFLSLYLEARGFSLLEIGQLVSILMLTKIVAPNIWGHIADKTHRRLSLVRLGSFLTLGTFLLFFWAESFWQFAFVLILFSFFWNAVIPQFEVLTLHMLAEHKDRYSRVRLWGSVGFVVSVSLAGVSFDAFGIGLFPWLILLVIFLIWLASLSRFSEPGAELAHTSQGKGFYQALLKPAAIAFFASCFLLQLSHGAYYAYFSLYLESLGYDKSDTGMLWALGVIAEVVLFVYMHHWFARHSVRSIMIASLALTSLRWFLLSAFAENTFTLICSQMLHAFSFGALHATAIKYVHATFGLKSQGRAQALYSSMGFGAGGGLGVFVSSYWVSLWGFELSFALSGIISFCALILIWSFFPRQLKAVAS